MYLNLNPGALGISVRDPHQLIDLAADAGFGGVDLSLSGIETQDAARALGDHLRERKLQWGLFGLPCDFSSATPEQASEAIGRLEKMLPLVTAAGCQRTYNHIWPGHNTLEHAANFRHHVAQFTPLARRLADHGVHFGLEFIGPKTLRDTFKHPFIHTLAGVTELADAIGHGTDIVLDTYHWWTSGGTMDEIARVSAKRIVNVHVNDATAGRSREQQQDLERQMPLATGLIDSAAFVRTVANAGYAGPVMVEPFNPSRDRFAKMPPADVLREVRQTMDRVLPR